MLAAQGIGESKRLTDLLCADEKASAISFPFFGSGHEFGSGHLGPNLELEALFGLRTIAAGWNFVEVM